MASKSSNLLSYYLTMNVNNICRVCLEKSSKLAPIFDPVKPPHFSILMMACAAVQVHEGDGLPSYICQRCISRLNIAFQFKTQCETSDAKLRQCFDDYGLENEQEFTASFQTDNKKCIENQENQTRVASEAETDNQQVFGLCQEKPLPEISEPINKQVEDSYKVEPGIDSCQESVENDVIKNITDIINNQDKQLSRKPQKLHQCNTCGKAFKSKPSLVHHIRIHTGERPYICHLCQKRFINGGHLHTHMKKHTGEKNYICTVCSKGFTTAQQLTKHTIAIHTSERPYGCTYCAKRFASSSNLNTHIKIHTGEKNFHCEVCGKTFSTKGQLQQHLLIHTGEKAFLCEYCNKRFSQKAHLMRHLKTHSKTAD